MTRPRLALLASVLVAAPSLPARADAQVRASEIGTVSQTVDGTIISLSYSRPRLRGRTGIFGSREVPWGETWTPGANWATTIDVDHDVTIEGHPLAKGKYSVWMIVRERGDWTLVLDAKARRFHVQRPDSAAAQFRATVHPQRGPATEVLTWSFPDVEPNGTTLAMQWDTVRVALAIQVAPTLVVQLPAADAAPYLGHYARLQQGPPLVRQFPEMVVSYENGTLMGELVPMSPYLKRFALIRLGPDTFVPGLYDEKGSVYEVLRPELTFTFQRTGSAVTGIDGRDSQDKVVWSGTRKP